MNFITMPDLTITYIIMIPGVHFIIMVQDLFFGNPVLGFGVPFLGGWQQDYCLMVQGDHRHFTRILLIIRIRRIVIILIDNRSVYSIY